MEMRRPWLLWTALLGVLAVTTLMRTNDLFSSQRVFSHPTKNSKRRVAQPKKQKKHKQQQKQKPTIHDQQSTNNKPKQSLEEIETIKMQHVESHQKLDQSLVDGVRVVVDLSFCADQSDRECHSLLKQLSCVYGYLKKCPLDELIAVELASFHGRVEQLSQHQGVANWKITRHADPIDQVVRAVSNATKPFERVVYLTPDSPNVLSRVDHNDLYVVGGIVDRTVRKNQSLNRATKLQIQTARLPVQEHLDCRTHVLNVDAVLIILNEMANHRDWQRAFNQAIPKRLEKKQRQRGNYC